MHSPLALLLSAPLWIALAAPAQVRFAANSGAHLDPDVNGQPLRACGLATGDLDGDRNLDLVLGCEEGVFAALGDRAGVFSAPRLVSRAIARRVLLVDVDRDGDLDIVVGAGSNGYYTNPGRYALLRNDGKAGFTEVPSAVPAILGQPLAIVAGDLDRDGDPDLLLVHDRATSPLSVWINDGSGSFTDQTATRVTGLGTGTATFGALVDLDGDGDLDIVVTINGIGQLFRNDGKGSLARTTPWSGPSPIVGTGDFDGDGAVDLVSSSAIYRNDKTGLGFTLLATGAFGGAVSVADFDGDRRLDLLAADPVGRPILLLQKSAGQLTDATTSWFDSASLTSATPDTPFVTMHATDLDGDGDPDLITGGLESRANSSTTVGIPPRVYINAGGQKLVRANQPAFPFLQAGIAAVAAGDVDGDGDVDLYLHPHGHYDPRVMREGIWLQDHQGRFVQGPTVPGNGICGGAAFADVDGDGDLDLLTVRGWDPVGPPNAARHRLFLNDGKGNFSDVTTSSLPATAFGAGACIAVGDVDGDGDLDFVTGEQHPTQYGSSIGAQNRLFLNDGRGKFSDATAFMPSGADDTTAIRLADLDGDGDLDLLVQNGRFSAPPAGMALRLLRNDGMGRFTDETAARLPALTTAKELDVVDLDGDGDLDITLDGVDLLNDGTGRFTARTAASGRLLSRDFDEDGRPDDLLRGFRIGAQSLGIGTGVEGFGALAVDLDRDQDLDLVLYGLGPADSSRQPYAIVTVRVFHNLRRSLSITALPRLGQAFRVQLRSGVHSYALPAIAPALANSWIQLPGLGHFGLDPALHVLLPVWTVPDADTPAVLEVTTPNDPALAGMTVAMQALVAPANGNGPARLSNVAVHEVLR
ncbi:MAG: VCBS repeat-containing protein [Planctomycetes bacterium]|nr:VCBS repeat-containing protein [Planctomycetota bacterium]MCB9869581.1 VCBS repeat-containing protein [Planctomycetota bacterium]